jgi:hypothetical protein
MVFTRYDVAWLKYEDAQPRARGILENMPDPQIISVNVYM